MRLSDYEQEQSNAVLSLSLEEAVALAVRENRSIKSAFLQRTIQKFDLSVSQGKFLPKLTLSTSALGGSGQAMPSHSKVLSAATALALPTGATVSLVADRGLGMGNGRASMLIAVKQPLLKNGGIGVNSASVRVAELTEQVNRLALRSAMSQTVVQVVYTYRELLRAQAQQALALAALERSQHLLDVSRALIAAGRMAAVELLQTEADLAGREVALEEADNQIDASRLGLLTLLAIEPRTSLRTHPIDDVSQPSVNVQQAIDKALTHHADHQIALLMLERAKIQSVYADNQKRWDLSLVAESRRAQGSAGLGAADGTLVTRNGSSFAGLQLSIPLGDRSSDQAAVRAKVELETQELKVLEVRQSLEQHVRDALRNVQTRWRQLELSEKTLRLSWLKLNAERDKLQAGRSTNFQVLSFENDLRQAEISQLNARMAYLNALTDLDERMGTTLDTWGISVAEAAHDEN